MTWEFKCCNVVWRMLKYSCLFGCFDVHQRLHSIRPVNPFMQLRQNLIGLLRNTDIIPDVLPLPVSWACCHPECTANVQSCCRSVYGKSWNSINLQLVLFSSVCFGELDVFLGLKFAYISDNRYFCYINCMLWKHRELHLLPLNFTFLR